MWRNHNKKKKETGDQGEEMACHFLENHGFQILQRNYRYQRIGEIDIIVKKQNLIAFIEVKYRNIPLYGGGLYSIGEKKMETLRKTAMQYLATHPSLYTEENIFRFDLISITGEEIQWIKDIFR
ncbi:MAG: YraN family protein [Spirochaetota bacterium]|nr:YraN family protein [Spirochaetota bacterium]